MSRTNPDVIFLFTAAGEVLYASGPRASVFGYRPEEVTGHSALEFIHSADHDRSREALRTVLAAPGAQCEMEVRVRLKNGEWSYVKSTLSNFLKTPRIEAVVATCRQTAPLSEAAEALLPEQRRQDCARQLEEFAHAVAHDLRQPLRTIGMFTEILLRKTELDPQGEEFARNIVDGVNRMTALLTGLHAFAIGRSDEPPRRVDVSKVLAEVLRDLGHAITSSGATVTGERLPFVRGHENGLSRVLQNLIMNAIKYRGDAPPQIHISAEAAGADWIISVRDNGVGIPGEYRERIFRPFERLHGSSIPGVGMGLSICRKIVESMGGRIWVTDNPGTGATFHFTIAAVGEELHAVNGNLRHVSSEAARAQGG